MAPVRQILGTLTPEETEAIVHINNRKLALMDLAGTLAQQELKGSELYNRLVNDMTGTREEKQRWWESVSQKYQWQIPTGAEWYVDFRSREVSISVPEARRA